MKNRVLLSIDTTSQILSCSPVTTVKREIAMLPCSKRDQVPVCQVTCYGANTKLDWGTTHFWAEDTLIICPSLLKQLSRTYLFIHTSLYAILPFDKHIAGTVIAVIVLIVIFSHTILATEAWYNNSRPCTRRFCLCSVCPRRISLML